jgi:hypothetical protein
MPPRSSSMERKSVTVRVPATSANMGPGYDSLGMAVEIWNELTVERASEYSMTIEGEGADELPTQEEGNLVCIGLKAVFEHAGKEVPPLKYTCKNVIPFARGLGSSSAAIISGILAGAILCGHTMDVRGSEELLQVLRWCASSLVCVCAVFTSDARRSLPVLKATPTTSLQPFTAAFKLATTRLMAWAGLAGGVRSVAAFRTACSAFFIFRTQPRKRRRRVAC